MLVNGKLHKPFQTRISSLKTFHFGFCFSLPKMGWPFPESNVAGQCWPSSLQLCHQKMFANKKWPKWPSGIAILPFCSKNRRYKPSKDWYKDHSFPQCLKVWIRQRTKCQRTTHSIAHSFSRHGDGSTTNFHFFVRVLGECFFSIFHLRSCYFCFWAWTFCETLGWIFVEFEFRSHGAFRWPGLKPPCRWSLQTSCQCMSEKRWVLVSTFLTLFEMSLFCLFSEPCVTMFTHIVLKVSVWKQEAVSESGFWFKEHCHGKWVSQKVLKEKWNCKNERVFSFPCSHTHTHTHTHTTARAWKWLISPINLWSLNRFSSFAHSPGWIQLQERGAFFPKNFARVGHAAIQLRPCGCNWTQRTSVQLDDQNVQRLHNSDSGGIPHRKDEATRKQRRQHKKRRKELKQWRQELWGGRFNWGKGRFHWGKFGNKVLWKKFGKHELRTWGWNVCEFCWKCGQFVHLRADRSPNSACHLQTKRSWIDWTSFSFRVPSLTFGHNWQKDFENVFQLRQLFEICRAWKQIWGSQGDKPRGIEQGLQKRNGFQCQSEFSVRLRFWICQLWPRRRFQRSGEISFRQHRNNEASGRQQFARRGQFWPNWHTWSHQGRVWTNLWTFCRHFFFRLSKSPTTQSAICETKVFCFACFQSALFRQSWKSRNWKTNCGKLCERQKKLGALQWHFCSRRWVSISQKIWSMAGWLVCRHSRPMCNGMFWSKRPFVVLEWRTLQNLSWFQKLSSELSPHFLIGSV